MLEVMQKVAAALEVSLAELGEDAATVRPIRKSRPTSKLQKVFDDVGWLPRPQQEKIVEVVSALMSRYENG